MMHKDDEVNQILAKLIRCFAAVFPALGREQIESASVENVEAWDSIAGVTLVTAIEEEFGTELDPDAVELFVSFHAIRDYLTQIQTGHTNRNTETGNVI
jgi:acyl carrier protein